MHKICLRLALLLVSVIRVEIVETNTIFLQFSFLTQNSPLSSAPSYYC